jgi:hypothetical protein
VVWVLQVPQASSTGHTPYGWTVSAITIFGVVVLTFMMIMYALERRDRRLILAFALGCALSSSYGFLSGAWPFGVVEAVWCLVALHRYYRGKAPTRRPLDGISEFSAGDS